VRILPEVLAMMIRTLAFALLAGAPVAALATDAPGTGRPLRLADVVSHLESNYPGEVVAIQYDASGDRSAHYHVDMRFPSSGFARIDVDAVTLAIASRDRTTIAGSAATLSEAAAIAAAHVPGQIVVAELDGTAGVAAHYDVDVRLPRGGIAQLKIDPTTRQIAWRNPAIVVD
jgi:uncharacterized membrane protein YkoI